MKLEITHSEQSGKKYKAVFTDGTKHKTIHFGASGYEDYTQHGDKTRREKYLSRHKGNEDWSNPKSAGALSRWILWGDSTSFHTNLSNFKKKFNLK